LGKLLFCAVFPTFFCDLDFGFAMHKLLYICIFITPVPTFDPHGDKIG